ncbi:MAG: hypothetical protein ACPL0A_00010 [Candidatus Micrarchaeia archaeon]
MECMNMRRGFVFMLDAFMSLLIVIAFVSTLNQLSRDYSYIQDEALYSYGRSMMNILLYKNVTIEVTNGVERDVPFIHAFNKTEWEKIDKLIPQQYGYAIQYYDGTNWKDLYKREKKTSKRSVSVVSVIPLIIENEHYTTPYKYGNYCDPGKKAVSQNANVCVIPQELYTPDTFATGNAEGSAYENMYVRVVVSI